MIIRLNCGCVRIEHGDEVSMKHNPQCDKVDRVLPLDQIGRNEAARQIRDGRSR